MNIQSVKQRFGIVGQSSLLDHALETAIRVSSTDLTVLITGESGVGKEVFSKIIHQLSPRKHNNFIAVNCGAIPSGTINSELFGHEKGAFTGASSDRKGYFETVSGGTIFLDEIGEMPMDTQAFLLRVLESGEFIRVGSSKTQRTDVRIVAATNVDLLDKIKKGKFREDLYYRLNTVPISVPSLKERREDIYLLFRKFAADFADKYKTNPIRLDDRAQIIIENYGWPGNIRELKNAAEQLSILSEDRAVTGEQIIELLPKLLDRNLPALRSKQNGNGQEDFQEREILYKLLFDMKGDLNDLKSLIFELIKNNDLSVPDINSLRSLQKVGTSSSGFNSRDFQDVVHNEPQVTRPNYDNHTPSNSEPIIINHPNDDHFEPVEVVEENLSIEEMEKELIDKALKKHRGRRKEAAQELGISERTLYRKIKQYGIKE